MAGLRPAGRDGWGCRRARRRPDRRRVRARRAPALTPAGGTIPVALCFDVEPDALEVALEAQPWRGFEALVAGIETLRTRLADATGREVRFAWFLRMDPQVADSHGEAGWVARRYGQGLQALRAAGDTIGLHPHAWRWRPGQARWVADHADRDWVLACARMSLEAYAAVFGEPCRAWRFGDRFVDPAAVRLGAEHGIRFDLTLEPGTPALRSMHPGTMATGRIPSNFRVPRTVFRASAVDPRRPARPGEADAGVWMIPLTSLDPTPILPRWRRVRRRVRRPFGPPRHVAALFAPWPADFLWPAVERDLETADRPHLAFAVRSDATLHEPFARALEEKIAALIALPLARRLAFTTPEGVVDAAGAIPVPAVGTAVR